MNRAWREADASVVELHTIELLMLRQYVQDVAMRLAPDEPLVDAVDPDDPFAAWEASMDVHVPETLDERDPLLDRLFPSVHPEDQRASAEFRRFTEPDQRRSVVDHAAVVDAVLAEAVRSLLGDQIDPATLELDHEATAPVRIADAQLEAWLKIVNVCRVGLAMELNIRDAEDAEALETTEPDDESAPVVAMYELLSFFQSVILELVDVG